MGVIKKILINIIFIFACGTGYAATTLYVWTNSPNPGTPYNAWTNAARTIQTAVDATSDGDTVLVTNGTYDTGGTVGVYYATTYISTNRVMVPQYKSLTIRSVNGPDVTIIKGAPDAGTGGCGPAAVRCVFLAWNNVCLSGFTLTNGYTGTSGDNYHDRSGGGIDLHGFSEVVSNCVISGNKADYRGGGVIFYYAGILTNCTLTANSCAGDGGGATFAWGGTMSDCMLNCNTSSGYGGGVCFYNGGGTMNNCTLSNNVAVAGGGAYFLYQTSTMNKCLLVNNRATATTGGGGVYMNQPGTDGLLNNCLLIGNTSPGAGQVVFAGGGRLNNCTLVAGSSGARMNVSGAMTNCILWGNTNYDVSIVTTGIVSYTCSREVTPGEGNIGVDPQFVNTNTANYRLNANSPCVNTGTNQGWMTNSVDFDGRMRIRYGRVDMGAYECLYSGTIYSVW